MSPMKHLTILLLTLTGTLCAQPQLPYDDLAKYLADVKAGIFKRGSEAFRQPSERDQTRFTECMRLIFAEDVAQARSCFGAVNYNLSVLRDAGTRKDYYVAAERKSNAGGLGTYILDPHYSRNVILEVPHPLFDAGTPEEALLLFQKGGARAIFISGTHRCANLGEASTCGGRTTACSAPGGPRRNEPFRVSDAAHFDQNFFTAAHRATLTLTPQPIALSVHGNTDEPVEAELSDGTGNPAARNALVIRFRNALVAHGVKAGSCNWAADDPSRFALCGETNVQGKLSNGAQACTQSPRSAAGTFLHIEQRRELRDNPEPVLEAFRQVFPADGPGAPGRQ